MVAIKLEKIKAKDLMSKDVIKLDPQDKIADVLGKMSKHKKYEFPVVKKKKLVGMIGYNHIMKRMHLPMVTHIEHVMTPPPRLNNDHNIYDITDLMLTTGFSILPVTKNDKLLGMVSKKDIGKIITQMEELAEKPVSSVMTPNPTIIGEKDHLNKAKSIMRKLDENFIPVVNEQGNLAGVVSHREVMKLMASRQTEAKKEMMGDTNPVDVVVDSIMRPAHSLTSDVKLGEAVKKMLDKDVSYMIVTEDKKPVGVITYQDLLELISSIRRTDQVYVQISGLHDEDSETYEAMYELIGKRLKTFTHLFKPKTFLLHASPVHSKGGDIDYELSIRMATERGMYYTKSEDWHLLKALDDGLDNLERQLKKDKDKLQEH